MCSNNHFHDHNNLISKPQHGQSSGNVRLCLPEGKEYNTYTRHLSRSIRFTKTVQNFRFHSYRHRKSSINQIVQCHFSVTKLVKSAIFTEGDSWEMVRPDISGNVFSQRWNPVTVNICWTSTSMLSKHKESGRFSFDGSRRRCTILFS